MTLADGDSVSGTTAANTLGSRLPRENPLASKLESLLTAPLLDPNAPPIGGMNTATTMKTGLPDDGVPTSTGDNEVIVALELLADQPQTSADMLLGAADGHVHRRNLRGTMERRRARVFRQICNQFHTCFEEVEAVDATVQAVAGQVSGVQEQLERFQEQTARLVREAHRLQAEQQDVRIRTDVVNAFLRRFTIHTEDLALLTSADDSKIHSELLSHEFFVAIQRIQQMQSDCKLLLAIDRHQAGTDIQEALSSALENAYHRLVQWTKDAVQTLSIDFPELNPALRQSIQVLKYRVDLLQYVSQKMAGTNLICTNLRAVSLRLGRMILDEITVIRKAAILQSFGDAMIRGGTAQPIEMLAHDAKRYLADILAWIHQTCCSERELLEQIFSGHLQSDETDGTAVSILPENGFMVRTILDRSLEGLCRPLRMRLDQILASQKSLGTSYKIANMIQFYTRMIDKTVHGKSSERLSAEDLSSSKTQEHMGTDDRMARSPLLDFLEEMTQSAFKVFYEILQQSAQIMMQSVQAPPADLRPAETIVRTTGELREIMESYETSLVLPLSPSSENGTMSFHPRDLLTQVSDREEGFLWMMAYILDPLLQLCTLQSEKLDAPFKQAVYSLNCLDHVSSILESHLSITRARFDAIAKLLDLHSRMIQLSGLGPLLEGLKKAEGPLSRQPGLDGPSVRLVLAGQFRDFVSSLNLELVEHLRFIQSAHRVRFIAQESVGLFLKSYRTAVHAIMDPQNGYEFPATSVLVQTAEEVETLVGVGLRGSALDG